MKLYSLFILFLSISGIAFSMDNPREIRKKIKLNPQYSFLCENGEVIPDLREFLIPDENEQRKFFKESCTIYRCSAKDKDKLIEQIIKLMADDTSGKARQRFAKWHRQTANKRIRSDENQQNPNRASKRRLF